MRLIFIPETLLYLAVEVYCHSISTNASKLNGNVLLTILPTKKGLKKARTEIQYNFCVPSTKLLNI